MAWEKTEDWKNALESIGMTEFFRDTTIPDSIDGVLSDGNWEIIFHQYTKAEYNSENIEFLRAVRTFETSGDLNQAAEIYKEFVAETAPRQVNLRGSNRADLDEIFGPDKEGIGPPNLFDGARDEIIGMIKNDAFPRFKASASKAQQAMAEEIDWDNIGGRDRSESVAGPSGGGEAAWHPDPAGKHDLRYWDGSAWTDHVSTGGQTSTDPM